MQTASVADLQRVGFDRFHCTYIKPKMLVGFHCKLDCGKVQTDLIICTETL